LKVENGHGPGDPCARAALSAPKRIALLGSTGSIGRQALEVIAAFPDRFRVASLSCLRSADDIVAQARSFHPDLVGVADPAAARAAAAALAGTGIEVAAGAEAAVQCALVPGADLVLAAATGVAGLPAVWAAVQAGREVALANKEPLVVAGHLITAEAARTGATLLPVDSEHSAVFQCLLGQDRGAVRRVVLTASGGAFRSLPAEELEHVTPAQALAHPTWRMGPKVTVDSATLMNKGLELIEARWLFGLRPEQLDVVLHAESIVHSLVDFVDGSVLAQLARPDMRLPIQFALSYPERWPRPEAPLDLARLGTLHFEPLGEGRWPAIALARRVLNSDGTAAAVMNAADEVAVEWFLSGRISFTQIPRIVAEMLERYEPEAGSTVEELLAVDRDVRRRLEEEQGKWEACSSTS
jgi:1-deoxy-D-xylulose-5-phosphate reductoisomerase